MMRFLRFSMESLEKMLNRSLNNVLSTSLMSLKKVKLL